MKSAQRMALFLPLILLHWGAQAQIFMCKDASGRTLTSDRPIPECADRTVREFDRSGTARREIPAPLTAEQKRQNQLQEEKRKAEEAAADDQKRSDLAIRMRYRSEADIDVARKRSIEPVEEQLKREKMALAAAEKQQIQVQAEADSHKKKNAAIPAAVQRKVDDSARAISEAKEMIRNRDAEIGLINAKYDATLKRFRELAGTTAAK
jgi:hypothetical protein